MTPSIEPPAERACERCEFRDSDGLCHLNPPTLIQETLADGYGNLTHNITTYRPWVGATDWCAQFTERKG